MFVANVGSLLRVRHIGQFFQVKQLQETLRRAEVGMLAFVAVAAIDLQ